MAKTMDRRSSRARVRAAAGPAVEAMEGRTLFNVTLSTYLDFDGHRGLRIRGDNAADIVIVNEDPNDHNALTPGATDGKTQIVVPTQTGGPLVFAGGEFEVFDVRLTGGNDTLLWTITDDFSFGSDVPDNRTYLLDVGAGNDTLTFTNGNTAVGDDSNIGFEIDGDAGNDAITVDLDDVVDAAVNLDVHSELGNDAVFVNVGNVLGETASADVNVDLGAGKNTLLTQLEDVVESRVQFNVVGGTTTGSAGGDAVNMVFQGAVVGDLVVNASLLAGNDTATVLLSERFSVIGAFGPSAARFSLNGNDGNDRLSVQHLGTTEFPFGVDNDCRLTVNLLGGNGDDQLLLDLSDEDGYTLFGFLNVRVDGGNDKDDIATLFEFDALSDGVADVAVHGGQHNDAVSLVLWDESGGNVSYLPSGGPAGFVLFDGGAGSDKYSLVTNVVAHVRRQNFESGSAVIVP